MVIILQLLQRGLLCWRLLLSLVPVWSAVTAGGVLLRDLNPDIGTDQDPENWQEIHRQVVQSNQDIRDLKGYHSWAAALSITDLCAAILNDTNSVRPVSTYVKVRLVKKSESNSKFSFFGQGNILRPAQSKRLNSCSRTPHIGGAALGIPTPPLLRTGERV